MKRILFFLFLIATTGVMAQSSKVVSAYNARKDGDYKKALEYIDEAAKNEKTMADPKTWVYRGQIYQQIILSEEDFGVDKVTAIKEGLASFNKAKEFDSKDKWAEDIDSGVLVMKTFASNLGIQAYNEKQFESARDYFLIGEQAAAEAGEFDTLAVYNAGLAAEQAGDMETAIEQYKKAAGAQYLGANMYIYMANLYEKEKMPEKYLEIVKEGRKAYPDNSDLIVYELNYYLRNNKYEEAENNLKLAIEKEPDNKQLQFSLGVVYDNLGRRDDAKVAYEKAIAIDPEYFDAIFNLGAMYFNQGVEMNNGANEITDNKKYNAARAEAKKVFEKARPYLEKAHALEPGDVSAIVSLSQLYALTGDNEKYKEMKAKEEALKE
ncbi:tetratricopeptide repeat protein [Cryomorpha ignava]|uniref:Tetratricopeptide repeat protein n=1 Tax=Cryomorpha ignava TaxID=101383 RepID=A0A7K3WST9_9FLAO|nr:tetratricopeptide repeat protein [Cryomorpha ignava]NEN23725.1 tetratricopeptide repeat protein [Cryomorpha ignava]